MNNFMEPIRIELPLGIMFPSVNCYLVPGDQLTLIDAGWGTAQTWSLFQKKINSHGFEVKDIDQIIITHEHPDHIGLINRIRESADATLAVPRAIKNHFLNPKVTAKQECDFTLQLFHSFGFPEADWPLVTQYFEALQFAAEVDPHQSINFFDNGDTLSIGNLQWEVLHTPGHSPTQFVFIQKDQKRIFSSDMLLPLAPMPIIAQDPTNPQQPTHPLPDLIASLKRLKSYDLQKVYPGHGPAFTNANAIIDRQLARIHMRQLECLATIEAGATTPYQVNRKMYPQQVMPPDFSGMYMVMGYIDLLVKEEKINRTTTENGMIRLSPV